MVNDICIVFHFGAEKMMFQANCEGWRSGFGKALSNELITYFFSNHIITKFLNILITKWLITFLPRNFFGGGPNGKVIFPGILVIWPVDNSRDSKTKNPLLAQKLHIVVPSGQLKPHWSMFLIRKSASLVP